MADTTTAPADGGFFGTADQFLGTINAFGTSILNLRDRYAGRAATTADGGPGSTKVASGAPGNTVAATRPDADGFWTVPRMLLVGSLVLLGIGVAVKLTRD